MQRFQWRFIVIFLSLLSLCACVDHRGRAPEPDDNAALASVPPPLATDLPCAVISSDNPLTIGFPALSLYRGGAVLPSEEGLGCLDDLADWLGQIPLRRWQVRVSGEAGYGVDPLALASKREELRRRFFARRGFAMQGWQWLSVAGQGNQLQLVELKGTP